MSIDRRLQAELRQEALQVRAAPALDAKVYRSAIPVLERKRQARNSREPGRRTYWKAAMIAACILIVLSGFGYGMQRLYQLNGHEVRLQVYSDTSLQLTRIGADEVRREVERVKAKLPVGGSAVVYFAAFAEERHPMLRDVPGVGVSRQEQVRNWTEWSGIAEKASVSLPIPERLSGGFSFASGFMGVPFGGLLGPEGAQALKELKKLGEKTGDRILWKAVEADPLVASFLTTEYRNEAGEQLFLTAQLLPAGSELSLATNAKEHAATASNGTEIQYTSSYHMLSPTGTVQSVTWVGGEEEKPVVYQLAAASERWTAGDLASLIEELIP
ncbi:hypothetical protein [Paenibacillus sp.]|uniref:hypothetical protein n=1 Tax=Paenibacillus sp. TaxID=58172 RepID=UPI002810F705|nr:hypothetical protein [Paenibacillus sp.]